MNAYDVQLYLQCEQKAHDLNLSLEFIGDTFSLTSKSGGLGRFPTVDSLWFYLLGVEYGKQERG
jgi:hypothetical protein